MRHWRTTENSNVAIQTGSTCISDTMTDITTILTANLGFSTTASSQKMSTSVYNIEWQQEIAIWPPTPEVVIPPELGQIAWQFQRQIWGFRPRLARRYSPRTIAIMTNNRKWYVAPQTGYTYISGTMTGRMTIPAGNLGFWPRLTRRNWSQTTATTIDNRKWQYRRFARQSCNFW